MLGRRSRIEIKSPEQLRHMRAAGLVVADTLAHLRSVVQPGISTAELDAEARLWLRQAGATSNFLGYQGFTGVICASVNDEVVHGIPGSRVLAEGDLISLDFGAIIAGWHGDAAITVAVGSVTPTAEALSEATERALWAGIAQAQAGNRLTDIGAACEASIGRRYGIVTDFVGHGIGSAMHMEPSVPHVGPPGHGPQLRPGMALAIEPMITVGSPEVDILEDGWTVVTIDGSLAAHWEHSVAITEDGPVVLTDRDGGRARLAALGVQAGSLD